jgi:hypothetical protein
MCKPSVAKWYRDQQNNDKINCLKGKFNMNNTLVNVGGFSCKC